MTTVGGTQSVIRTILLHRIGADRVRVLSTWQGPSRWRSAALVLRAALALLLVPREAIVHFHVSKGGAWLREGSLIRLARLRGLRVVVTLHGFQLGTFATAHPTFVRTVLRPADHIICLSDEARQIIGDLVGAEKVSVVPNPMAIDREAPPVEDSEPLVLFAGEVGYRKGVDVLVEAWRALLERGIEGELHIVGPRADFHVPPLDRLVLHGEVHPSEVPALLRRARVVVLPSRAEGMPMILTESLAAGRPFVATPVGGVATIAPDPAMLVPVGEVSALADAIATYLSSRELAGVVGRRGREHIAATRSPEVVDRRLRDIYSGITR